MKGKILRGSIIAVVLIMFLVSSVNADTNADEETQVMTLSKGGLVINYPSDWGYSQATSNCSIMSISKLDSIDSKGVGQVNINFEKKPIEGDFYTFVNSTYKSMQYDASFKLISSGESVIGDREALEYIYTSNDDGMDREHKAVWFEKGGQAYVMLYSAPVDQFEQNLYVADYILSDIQIT
ncbi:PsbP-related protein [Methanobrevibacter sp.]